MQWGAAHKHHDDTGGGQVDPCHAHVTDEEYHGTAGRAPLVDDGLTSGGWVTALEGLNGEAV
jgi:hypothetical protein